MSTPRQRSRPFRHIEHLLRLHFSEAPIRRQMIDGDLFTLRRDLHRLQQEGPYRSLGVASYNPDASFTPGRVSDSTADCAVAVQDKPEFRAQLNDLSHTIAWLEEGLEEYALLGEKVTAVLRLLDADLRAALEKMCSDGLRQSKLPVALAASTVSYHLTYAYQSIDRCLQHGLYRLPLPYLRSEHPQVFPGFTHHAGVRQRQGGMVLV